MTQTFRVMARPAGLVLVGLLEWGVVAGPSAGQGTQLEPNSALDAGQAREREIAGGEQHRYQVRLLPGQYLDASISPQGVTVRFRLESPDGKELFRETLPGGTGPKSIEWVAEAEGAHTLEVQSTSVETRRGRYRLEVKALRNAQPLDRARFAARMALEEGEQLVEQGKPELALAAFERALSLTQPLADPGLEGRVLDRMGRVLVRLGDLEAAAEALAMAFEQRRSLGPVPRGDALASLGSLARQQRNHEEAIRCFREAQSLMRAAGVRVNEAMAFNNMAAAYVDLGASGDAAEALKSAVAIFAEEGVATEQAQALSSLGRVYWELREPEEALATHRQAQKLWQRLGNELKQAEVLSDIGLDEYLVAVDRKQPEPLQTSIKHLDEALEMQKRLNDARGQRKTLQRLRQAHESRGDLDEAVGYARQALEISTRLPEAARGTDWVELTALARIETQRERLPEARSWVEKALASLESSRLRIADPDLRALYAGSVNTPFELHVDILMRLHERSPSEGLDQLALQASERGRARALRESLGEQRASVATGADPAVVQRKLELEKAVAGLESQLAEKAGGRQAGGKNGKKKASGRAKAAPGEDALRAELRAYVTELQKLVGQSRRQEALRRSQPADLAQIRSFLDDRSLVLEYELGPERSYLWAVTKRSWASFVLPKEADLEQLARRLPELLAKRTDPDPRASAQGLRLQIAEAQKEYDELTARFSEAILGPVRVGPEIDRLIFVWDGALNYVPVAALPLPKGWPAGGDRPAGPGGARARPSLISRYEIATLPSVSVAAALESVRGVRPPARKQVAVFADPVFSISDERARALPAPAPAAPGADDAAGPSTSRARLGGSTMSGVELVRLPLTAKLAEEALKLAPRGEGLAALGFEANREAVFSPELADYRMIIFGTHSLFNAEFPALSGIALSALDAKGQPREGFLRQYDVYSLDLNADLVVLAGCQTALGKEIRGEGLLGLSRGFLYAGSSRVVASLWKVEETATVELVVGMLKRVKEGKSYAAALRESQLSVARDPRWRAPYFWAGFVLQGDWR